MTTKHTKHACGSPKECEKIQALAKSVIGKDVKEVKRILEEHRLDVITEGSIYDSYFDMRRVTLITHNDKVIGAFNDCEDVYDNFSAEVVLVVGDRHKKKLIEYDDLGNIGLLSTIFESPEVEWLDLKIKEIIVGEINRKFFSDVEWAKGDFRLNKGKHAIFEVSEVSDRSIDDLRKDLLVLGENPFGLDEHGKPLYINNLVKRL